MTAPRQILPGRTYLVTRTCAQRQFLLRPSKAVTDIFMYVLAVAARRYDIRLHAFCVMSNHVHVVLTDVRGQLPAFQQYLGALVARAMNAALGRTEAFWGSDSYSAVQLVAPSDIVDKAAYTLANPVLAGLVPAGRLWPGAWSAPEAIDAPAQQVARPSQFFARKGSLPASSELELTTPPGFGSAVEFQRLLGAALEEKERDGRRKYARRGFVGAARVLKMKPTTRPRTPAPFRTLSPRIAARDPVLRVEALARLKRFLWDYRAALQRRRAGCADVEFPAGTYLLRVAHGVRCAALG